MNSQEITFWQNVIISNKEILPKTKKEQASYDIAEYLLFREKRAA
jgi:hypothetical protein